MGKILEYFKNPYKIVLFLSNHHCLNWLSDKNYARLIYRAKFGRKLNLNHPETFNEKLQWLKLYDRKDCYTTMVDKYEVKEYVANIMGNDCIIPTLGVWDSFDEIDFDALPNQFVLKCTHDSGGLVICKDKDKLDIKAAKTKINHSLKKNYYKSGREWPYKNVKPRIIAEQYLENIDKAELVEYKMFCFDGKVKMVLVCKGTAHGAGRTNDYCDRDLKRLPFVSLNPNSTGELEKPEQLSELIAFAEKLSAGIPQVRVDTYLMDGKIFFGELTFFHNSGFSKFEPEEWDRKLGEWITLPKRSN